MVVVVVVAVIHHRDDAVMREWSIRSITVSSTHNAAADDDDDDFNKPWGVDDIILRLARSMVCNVDDNNKVTPRNRLLAKHRELTNDAKVIKTWSNSGS